MKLTDNLPSIILFAIIAMNISAAVMANTLDPDRRLTASNYVYFEADYPPVEDEMKTLGNIKSADSSQEGSSLLKSGATRPNVPGSFTSSHSDAPELVKSGANVTDYALSVRSVQSNPGSPNEAGLGSYIDSPVVQQIALETDGVGGGSSAPEPSSIILFTLGLVGLGLMRRQKNMIRNDR